MIAPPIPLSPLDTLWAEPKRRKQDGDIHFTKCETGPFKLPDDPDYDVWPARWVGREAFE